MALFWPDRKPNPEPEPNNIAKNYKDEPKEFIPDGKNPDPDYPGWRVEYFDREGQ